MERIDLQHNQSIFETEDSLLIRNGHRASKSSNNYHDYNTLQVCNQKTTTKHNNGYHMRIRRYLFLCMVTLAILLLLYIPVYHHIIPTRIGENTKSASLDVLGMHRLALGVRGFLIDFPTSGSTLLKCFLPSIRYLKKWIF